MGDFWLENVSHYLISLSEYHSPSILYNTYSTPNNIGSLFKTTACRESSNTLWFYDELFGWNLGFIWKILLTCPNMFKWNMTESFLFLRSPWKCQKDQLSAGPLSHWRLEYHSLYIPIGQINSARFILITKIKSK